jgi:MFS family permease
LLCEPKWRIGLIGSCYFAGIITTILIIPYLVDRLGRRWIVIINYIILIVCTILICICTDILALYILLYIAGASFGGRIIGGLSWLVEFNSARDKELTVFIKMCSVSFWTVAFTLLF